MNVIILASHSFASRTMHIYRALVPQTLAMNAQNAVYLVVEF